MRLSDISHNPSARTLRQFAGLFLLLFGGLAAWRLYSAGPSPQFLALGAVAVLVGVTGLIAPRAVRWVFVGYMYLAFPIGWTISHIVLGVIFLVAIFPIGLIFRLGGRDRLRRRRPANETSYWVEKPVVKDPVQYYRQF